MSAIDEAVVIQKFINIVRSGVGSQLAQVGPTGSQYGAVVKKRSSDTAPPQPYIVVDIEDRVNISPLGINKSVNGSDQTIYERLETCLFSFRCYGTNAQRIMNDLHFYLDIDSVRDGIRTDTNGAIHSISSLDSSPIKLQESFLESSAFTLVWKAENNLTDTGSTTINTIDLTYN